MRRYATPVTTPLRSSARRLGRRPVGARRGGEVAPHQAVAVCGVVIAHRLAQGRGGGLVRLAQVPGGRARAGEGPRADGAGERPQHHVRPLVARQARSGLEARPALPADVRHGRRLAHPVLPVRATQYVVFFTFGAL